MGLRSNFPKIPKANYPTIDPKAIPPLRAHLGRNLTYVEPTAGAGHLIILIGDLARCVAAYDIEPRVHGVQELDVRQVQIGDADVFIGNPPWNPRSLLHEIIVHLSDQAPTWLLFDARWAFTKQAKPFLSRLRKIVTVGRLAWMIENPMPGKDDCAWYLFDKPIPGARPTLFEYDWTPEPTSQLRMCFDCRRQIGATDKWHLQDRNGVSTPVHKDCLTPTGPPPALISTPLLDLMMQDPTCGRCAHFQGLLPSGVGYCSVRAVWKPQDDASPCEKRRPS